MAHGKRKEHCTLARDPKQANRRLEDLENEIPNKQKAVSKASNVAKKILEPARVASQTPTATPRVTQRGTQKWLETFETANARVQMLKAKGENRTSQDAALLESESQRLDTAARVLRSFFQIPLQFRLEQRNDEARFWHDTHYQNPYQHLCHARLLVQRFYEKAPEMKDDLTSRGAVEFVAYLIAAKVGEEAYDLKSSELRPCLSQLDSLMLPPFKLIQLEKIFLMILGYKDLNFDMFFNQPPIVTWKESIKKGDCPATLSYERYLLNQAFEKFKKQTALFPENAQSFLNARREYQQAEQNYLASKKRGETFADHEGCASIRKDDSYETPSIPFYPRGLVPEENYRTTLEPLFPELQDFASESPDLE